MEKVCVFCGQTPKNKNREHIIPKWLIELTGDPKRTGIFGIRLGITPIEQRLFSFDSFQFPACEACNSEFSLLEGKVKPVLKGILENRAIDAKDICILFDWFDKVRVGLWLGFRYLNKDYFGVSPKFHIAKRIGSMDRVLRVYRIGPLPEGINFLGTDSAGFQMSPTIFGLRINDYLFVNFSKLDLVAERLGFPYSAEWTVGRDGDPTMALVPGTQDMQPTLVLANFPAGGVTLLQPIFKQMLALGASSLYENGYVRENSIDFEKGQGAIFLERRGSVARFGSHNLDIFRSLDANPFLNEIAALIIEEQQADFHALGEHLDGSDEARRNFERNDRLVSVMAGALKTSYRRQSLAQNAKI